MIKINMADKNMLIINLHFSVTNIKINQYYI